MAGFLLYGPDGRPAAVNERNQLETSSIVDLKSAMVSLKDSRTFNAVFNDASAAANDYVAYLQNTSTTRFLLVDLVRVGAANAALWKFWKVTGTASGTSVTATNMNLSSGITPEATIEADAVSGLSTDGEFARARNVAGAHVDVPFDDTLVLGTNDAFAIEYDTGTTGVAEVTIRFFYIDR